MLGAGTRILLGVHTGGAAGDGRAADGFMLGMLESCGALARCS
jgi:hypothetical protein